MSTPTSFNKKTALFWLLFTVYGSAAVAQFGPGMPGEKNKLLDVVQWTLRLEPEMPEAGQQATLWIEAKIDEGWYLYSSDFDPDCGPIVTSFDYTPGQFQLHGKTAPINPSRKFDNIFGCEYTYFKKKGTFKQVLSSNASQSILKVTINYQACTDEGKCIPYEKDFEINIKTKPASADKQPITAADTPKAKQEKPESDPAIITGVDIIAADTAQTTLVNVDTLTGDTLTGAEKPAITEAKQPGFSMWAFLFTAFLAGFAALATPCVWPMIPMTVSFFTKSKASGGKKHALFYAFSIILIYTLMGVLVSLLLGADAANIMSTHWLPNLIFFGVFVFFGLSFLGMFEIVLPSSWVNKVDAQADKGGYRGVFFMAFTLVLVSFSCTGPIVGSLLVQASQGDVLQPILGMVAYSLAVALPFGFFAFFPSMMSSLPKSGSWLNTVKVTLGFLEIALALKFLSMVDQVYHWGLLDREVFLAAWIAIFALLGIYLIGHIRLPHDDEGPAKISVPRLLMATVVFSFVIYMLPGMWGAPLKALAGLLPPDQTQDFYLSNASSASVSAGDDALPVLPVKHGDKLTLPHQLKGYFDYRQALEASAKSKKPVFIDFTGHGCVNCRKMEQNVWSQPEVLELLRKEFIVTALYVDDPTGLPEADWYTSSHDLKVKKSIGKQNADLQITKFGNNAQPFYVILNEKGEILAMPSEHYDLNPEHFLAFLKKGLEKHSTGH